MCAGGQAGWVDFIPNCFSEIPGLIERGKMAADVVFSMASPMDAHGYFSLSLAADYTMAAIAQARAVVLEVNPNVPFAFGNCHVHVSQLTALVESSEPVFTNDPSVAGLNDKLVAINATLQIDLLGQCGSESLGHVPYSGTGGQSDFVRAANSSRGGKAIIVLPSTARNDTISRIVPPLSPGTHVSTSKNDVDYVVTEYGVTQLRGKSATQRAARTDRHCPPDVPRRAASAR